MGRTVRHSMRSLGNLQIEIEARDPPPCAPNVSSISGRLARGRRTGTTNGIRLIEVPNALFDPGTLRHQEDVLRGVVQCRRAAEVARVRRARTHHFWVGLAVHADCRRPLFRPGLDTYDDTTRDAMYAAGNALALFPASAPHRHRCPSAHDVVAGDCSP